MKKEIKLNTFKTILTILIVTIGIVTLKHTNQLSSFNGFDLALISLALWNCTK